MHDINKSISFVAQSDSFQSIRMQCQRSGQKYKDNEFPAHIDTILGFKKNDSNERRRYEKLGWARPDEIFKGAKYSVYDHDIHPNDIKQGMLGDCYYLSAIAAIAEQEDRIKKLFLARKTNSEGVYCVALCINGMWEDVVLDD